MNSIDLKKVVKAVKDRINILDVISGYLKVDKNYKVLCPFHKENSPSFSVNEKGQYFYCFGCGVGGDVIRFIQLYKNVSFAEALKELSKSTNVNIPEFDLRDFKDIEEERKIEEILYATVGFYRKNLNEEALDYLLNKRSFTESTISSFQIGYANGKLRYHLLKQKNFSSDKCLKAGVLKKSNDGKIFDFFYKRIVFPSILYGRIVNLTGRSTNNFKPKYLNLPGKKLDLFNEEVLSKKEVFLTESITDCITLCQYDYPAVSILGALNFGDRFREKLMKCEKIFLCPHNDSAGIDGTLKIIDGLGSKMKVIVLPGNMDVNDYFKNHSKDDFKKLIEKAKDGIGFKINLIPKDTSKIELFSKLEPILKDLSRTNEAKSEAYLSYEIKERFDLTSKDIEKYRKTVKEFSKESSNKKGKQNEKIEYTALFGNLVDLVKDKGSPKFLVKEDSMLKIKDSYEIDDKLYFPPPKDQIPWLLPEGKEVLEHYRIIGEDLKEYNIKLYEDLYQYHKNISELPKEAFYDFLVCWDIHTYLLEKVHYSPMLCLYAVPERGKSRTGKGIIYVSYRGLRVESLRDAYIVRMAKLFQATIFFDVMDLWKKAWKNQCNDILLNRFEKDTQVPRILYPERGPFRDTVYFDIFGPTIMGINIPVSKILETRSVTINMPESAKKFEREVQKEDGLPLKARLLAFRGYYLDRSLPKNLKPASGRLGDILKPILQVATLVNPQRNLEILDLVKYIEDERLIEKSDSFEAQILKTVLALKGEVLKGILPNKVIADVINENKPDRYKFSYQRVGRILSAMGFAKTRTNEGASAIIWDSAKIERLSRSYGLLETSETSEISETPVKLDGNTDVTDDTDVMQKVLG